MDYEFMIDYILKRIKEIKKIKDISDDDIAEAIGYSGGSTISRKHQRRSLSLEYLLSISEYFQVDLFDLFPPSVKTVDDDFLNIFIDIKEFDCETRKMILKAFSETVKAIKYNRNK